MNFFFIIIIFTSLVENLIRGTAALQNEILPVWRFDHSLYFYGIHFVSTPPVHNNLMFCFRECTNYIFINGAFEDPGDSSVVDNFGVS